MPGVDEIRAGIQSGNHKTDEGIAALQQAETCFEEAQQLLAQATHGTTQDEMHQAVGALREAVGQLTYITNTARSSTEHASTYAARL